MSKLPCLYLVEKKAINIDILTIINTYLRFRKKLENIEVESCRK